MTGSLWIATRLLGLALAAPVAVSAMSASAPQPVRCQVDGAAKLPAASGGERALCAEVARALHGRATAVRIRVFERGRFAAGVALGARVLPTINFAQSDGAITGHSFLRFAQALSAHVARHQK